MRRYLHRLTAFALAAMVGSAIGSQITRISDTWADADPMLAPLSGRGPWVERSCWQHSPHSADDSLSS